MYITKEDYETLLDIANNMYNKEGKTEDFTLLSMILHRCSVTNEKSKERVRKHNSKMRELDYTYGNRQRGGTVLNTQTTK